MRRILSPTICEATRIPPAPPRSSTSASMSSLPASRLIPSIGARSSARAARHVRRQLEVAQLLLVVERRALAGGARHHDAVGAVFEQVLDQTCRRGLVDAAFAVERRDHRRDDASDAHARISTRSGGTGRVPYLPAAPGPRVAESGPRRSAAVARLDQASGPCRREAVAAGAPGPWPRPARAPARPGAR